LIDGRSVVILDAKDLENEADAIVTILHEAGHAFLGHKTAVCFSVDDKEGDEDECWNQVREWLPNEFMECIACHEREGGGTIMYAIEILDDYNIWQENLVDDNNIFSTVEDAENAIAKLKTRDGWELSTYRVTEIDK
jgi:hypothetical protein